MGWRNLAAFVSFGYVFFVLGRIVGELVFQ